MQLKESLVFLSLGLLLSLSASAAPAQTFGVKKKPVKPHQFGNVTMNNFSEAGNEAPAVFQHWLHRMKYTCRLCHVDLGFAMRAGDTGTALVLEVFIEPHLDQALAQVADVLRLVESGNEQNLSGAYDRDALDAE